MKIDGYVDPDNIVFDFPCIRLVQPVGELFIASMPYRVLCAISDFDVRQVIQEDRDLDRYLGIQRPLNPKRVSEIGNYVNFADAAFPSSIIIAIDERCASFDPDTSRMTLTNVRDPNAPVLARNMARVIDGQHRIAGLFHCHQDRFDCAVTILIGMDIADQAQMFARVNLSQTPVSPSLVYDLFELAKTRSPQKSCHEVTVRLDRDVDGPFFKRIKRLGTATPGRDAEYLTQATVVRGIMRHVSAQPDKDRDDIIRGRPPTKPSRREREELVFREWFIEGNEDAIFESITELFHAVRTRWPLAWNSGGRGYILARTTGYVAFMRFLRHSINYWTNSPSIISAEKHLKLLADIKHDDNFFTTEHFKPGSSGESLLTQILVDSIPK